jgi:hypothetical protein
VRQRHCCSTLEHVIGLGEHLLRDVGQGNLAVGTVALVALLTGGLWLARATGLAAVVANVPHQIYHQRLWTSCRQPRIRCCNH